MSEPDAVLTVSEVSQYLKLGKSTIYRLAKAQKLPCRKVGGAWRFSRKGIDDWLSQVPLEPAGHPEQTRKLPAEGDGTTL